jgi:hypothetical protein
MIMDLQENMTMMTREMSDIKGKQMELFRAENIFEMKNILHCHNRKLHLSEKRATNVKI